MTRGSRKLKIAVVSDAIYPYHPGGKEMRIHQLTRHLAQMGHDVHIYTMQWWEGAPDRIEHGVHLHAISRHHPLYVGRRRSIKQAIMFFFACFKLVRYDFDLLEVDHMPYFPLYAGKVVSLIKRRPMYATWHEVWGRQYWQKYLGLAGLIGYALERFTVFLPDHIIAVSPYTAERLRTMLHYRGPVSIAPNGIDGSIIQKARPASDASDVIYTGRLLGHKNVSLLIRAIGKLRTERPEIRCIIIGGGPEDSRLRQLIKELGLEHNVIMKGVLKESRDVMAHIKASRVFVLPSLREGFGVVALEAGACGLPVVTIDHPENAARFLVDHTGALCQPTVDSLAQAIASVLDRQTRPDAQQILANYDWGHIASNIAKVYAS